MMTWAPCTQDNIALSSHGAYHAFATFMQDQSGCVAAKKKAQNFEVQPNDQVVLQHQASREAASSMSELSFHE